MSQRDRSPSSSWQFRTPDRTVKPEDVISFASNCKSQLGKGDTSYRVVKNACRNDRVTNQDVCIAVDDAGSMSEDVSISVETCDNI